MIADVKDRRADLIAERDALRAKRGAAALDGKPFNSSRLGEIEAELAALDDADAEAERRRAGAAIDTKALLARALRLKLAARDEERLAALAAAETAAEQMVEALKTFLRHGAA